MFGEGSASIEKISKYRSHIHFAYHEGYRVYALFRLQILGHSILSLARDCSLSSLLWCLSIQMVLVYLSRCLALLKALKTKYFFF